MIFVIDGVVQRERPRDDADDRYSFTQVTPVVDGWTMEPTGWIRGITCWAGPRPTF